MRRCSRSATRPTATSVWSSTLGSAPGRPLTILSSALRSRAIWAWSLHPSCERQPWLASP
eukprot:8686766-Alexandrium_andersonii.AAC.1